MHWLQKTWKPQPQGKINHGFSKLQPQKLIGLQEYVCGNEPWNMVLLQSPSSTLFIKHKTRSEEWSDRNEKFLPGKITEGKAAVFKQGVHDGRFHRLHHRSPWSVQVPDQKTSKVKKYIYWNATQLQPGQHYTSSGNRENVSLVQKQQSIFLGCRKERIRKSFSSWSFKVLSSVAKNWPFWLGKIYFKRCAFWFFWSQTHRKPK